MNYKTMLLASAAVLFASQAMAQDLTGAFSVPGKGQIMSDTRLGLTREKARHHWWADDGLYASEELEYGITDQFSVNAGIANLFDREGWYNNDHNFEYNLGAKYTTRLCNGLLFQASGHYTTYNPKDFYGHKNSDARWVKYLGGELKLGYELADGLTAYGIYGLDSEIDNYSREIDQSLSAGLHYYTGKYALDAAIRYDFNTHDKNTHEWWLDAAADYYVKENVALGVYGSYFLDGDSSTDYIKQSHEVGLRVKVLF